MSFLARLKSLDAYPKLQEEFKVKTFSGACVSICAIFFILILFFSELKIYLNTETVDHLYVDVSRGEKLRINFDVTFPHIPCNLLSLDAMDVSGSHQLDVASHIKKRSLDKFGRPMGREVKEELVKPDPSKLNATAPAKKDPTKEPGYCGPCYGAETVAGQCCQTCDEVKEAYRVKGWSIGNLASFEQCVASGQTEAEIRLEMERGDGCQMVGYLEVNKVAGNFHFAPGKSFQHAHMHIHDLASFPAGAFNVSHRITRLSFGQEFPGIVNPLDLTSQTVSIAGGAMYMYYVKVVPTTYHHLSGEILQTNQFSVTEHSRPISSKEGQGLPGVFFFYELSPIMVKFTETRESLTHFLTQLCAILGGVFTVAGMVDRLVYGAIRQIEKKMEIGKLS